FTQDVETPAVRWSIVELDCCKVVDDRLTFCVAKLKSCANYFLTRPEKVDCVLRLVGSYPNPRRLEVQGVRRQAAPRRRIGKLARAGRGREAGSTSQDAAWSASGSKSSPRAESFSTY